MLVSGRYDESRGDPQIIADRLSLDISAAMPADRMPEPSAEPEPPWSSEGDRAPDSIVAALDNEEPPEFDSLPPDAPPPEYEFADAPSNGAPRDAKTAEPDSAPLDEPEWVNGGDHLKLPGDERKPDSKPRAISVTLVTSDDAEKDRRKLDRLHNVFVKYPGLDRFRIVIHRGEKRIPLRFPALSTGICDELERDLAAIVGSADFISIDEN